VRVREGGEVLDTVAIDRGRFACMLGGEDGRTLFIAAAHWRGMEATMSEGPGRTGQLLAAPEQPAPHAGRPKLLRSATASMSQGDRHTQPPGWASPPPAPSRGVDWPWATADCRVVSQ